ncbi:UNVERIFIED_CONTAM: hypothetical protein RMT77_000251 [Armadillidium vulgare]
MVILTLKNLQQQTFNIEIDLSASVRELKEKIEKENGSDYPAEGQKLIYAGKILDDDSNLESYNIDAKKFLVIMVSKPKAPPPSSAPSDPTIVSEETPTTTEETSRTEASAATTTALTTSSTSQTTTTTTTTTTTSSGSGGGGGGGGSAGSTESAESLIVMGEEFNRMVENIMEMGYERSQVERALRASFNNPYTAVQYLVDGIPPNLEYNTSQGSNPPSSRQSGEEHEGDDEDDPLDFLRNQPQFNHMRQMIRSNPQLLDAFIQQIGQTNPELLQVIQQNQEAFVRMLNEAPPSSGGSGPGTGGSTTGSGTGTGTGSTPSSGGQRGASGQNTILVSPQDRDAIERLKALGNFPEDVVIQAYFACEKNENLAAEFLFSQSWD